uniref:RxLR effector candidate protein n=1 Tax=Hyaloperonospora arabidopsidis (strain Emoy2) TaxID=559515 RepID=M4BB26_HYAAE
MELVVLLSSLHEFPILTVQANALKKALAAAYFKVEEFPVWLTLGRETEYAYHMMPISAKKLHWVDVPQQSEWLSVRNGLMLCLDYVDTYSAEFIEYSYDDVLKLMIKKRTFYELESFFDWLQGSPGN